MDRGDSDRKKRAAKCRFEQSDYNNDRCARARLTLLVTRYQARSRDVDERRIDRLDVADRQTDRIVYLRACVVVVSLFACKSNLAVSSILTLVGPKFCHVNTKSDWL